MPGRPSVGGTDFLGLAYLLIVLALAFGPMFLGRPPGGDDFSDPGGSDGDGPPDPPAPPRAPEGGIPLPDAVPARTRLRGHSRLADSCPATQRRPATTPKHKRVRVPY